MHSVERSANSTFTSQELARLAVYRAAVAAGFYTDWEGGSETPESGLRPAAEHAEQADEPAGGASATSDAATR